jgi:hypothetical protein
VVLVSASLKGGFTHVLPAGVGYDTWSGGFARAAEPMLVRLSDEYAKPSHVICYSENGTRMHTRLKLLRRVCTECANPAGQCCNGGQT